MALPSKRKILFLYSQGGEIITGGQKYEDRLYRELQTAEGLQVERRWLNNISGKISKYTSPLRNLRLLRSLRDYDLIFFNSVDGLPFIPLAWCLRFLRRQHTSVIHHHFLYREKTGVWRLWYKLLEKGFMRVSTTIAVPSPYINDLCRRMFPRHPLRYWQIPFEGTAPLAPAPVPGNLLYIGTIEPRKGLMYLLDAMTMLRDRGVDVRLTVVGKTVNPSYRALLDEKIAAQGLSVRFTGYISLEEKERIMSETDVFTFPSLMEGYGMVLCESMVRSIPCVTFDNSAMPYTVHHMENGLLCPDRDTAALAAAIERIVTDRPLRSRLAAGAIATSATFMTPSCFRALVTSDVAALAL